MTSFFPEKSQSGADNPNASLTEEDVRDMRQRHDGGASTRELAEEHGVTVRCVRDVVSRRSWGDV